MLQSTGAAVPRQPQLLQGLGSHYSRYAHSNHAPRVPLGLQVGKPALSVQEPAAAHKRQPKPQDGLMTPVQVTPPPRARARYRQHLANILDLRAIQI